jgi:hypothetical protein
MAVAGGRLVIARCVAAASALENSSARIADSHANDLYRRATGPSDDFAARRYMPFLDKAGDHGAIEPWESTRRSSLILCGKRARKTSTGVVAHCGLPAI